MTFEKIRYLYDMVTIHPISQRHFQRALSEWRSADCAPCWLWFESGSISGNRAVRIPRF